MNLQPVGIPAWIAKQLSTRYEIEITITVEISPGALVGLLRIHTRGIGDLLELPIPLITVEDAPVSSVNRGEEQVQQTIVVKISKGW